MTAEEFTAFCPRFAGAVPEAVLADLIARANARFSSFGPDAEEARRLFTAHQLTLLLRSDPAASGSSDASARVTGKRVGDVQITYAAPSPAASSSLADLSETLYGVRLLTLLRVYASPVYIP